VKEGGEGGLLKTPAQTRADPPDIEATYKAQPRVKVDLNIIAETNDAVIMNATTRSF